MHANLLLRRSYTSVKSGITAQLQEPGEITTSSQRWLHVQRSGSVEVHRTGYVVHDQT